MDPEDRNSLMALVASVIGIIIAIIVGGYIALRFGRWALLLLLLPSVVSAREPHLIRVMTAQGNVQSHGSGVCVWSNGRVSVVATAAHVIDTNQIYANGTRGRLVAIDRRADVALIEVPRRFFAVRLMRGLLRRGMAVSTEGFPGAGRRVTLRGRLLSQYMEGDWEASMPVRQGHSGGPAYNEAGEVCGIVWGADMTWTKATITPASHVIRLLERAGYRFRLVSNNFL